MNFISEDYMRRAGFSRTSFRTTILAVSDVKTTSAKGRTSFVVRPRNDHKIRISVEATVLQRISTRLPTSRVDEKSWRHLRGKILADPKYYEPGPVDIILGAELYVSLLQEGYHKGAKGEHDAFNTVFGWMLMGAVPSSNV